MFSIKFNGAVFYPFLAVDFLRSITDITYAVNAIFRAV
jgi:hypothetical protein